MQCKGGKLRNNLSSPVLWISGYDCPEVHNESIYFYFSHDIVVVL